MDEQERDERADDGGARSDEQPGPSAGQEPRAPGDLEARGPNQLNQPRPFGGDFRGGRRRGRRGRGGGQRFGPAPRVPGMGGPRPPGTPVGDDEESSQARELAAYERRQQQRRPGGPFRGPGWVAGARPAAAGGAFRPAAGGFRQGSSAGFRTGGRPMGAGRGPRRAVGYSEQVRRMTAGPRAQAAPSHEAGEPIAGPHAVLEAIRAGRVVKRLFVSNERGTQTGPVAELIQEAQQRRIFIRFVDAMEISRLSPIESHQGVVAIAEGKAGVELEEFLLHLDALSEPALVLLIDSLQDPQNFGVLLRSAEGTGVDGVVIPKHRAVGLTPAVAKTSAGASEHLMIAEVANLRQAVDALKEKGIWVVGTDESGELLYDEVDYRGPTAIVVGGEAEGIRRLVLEGCDQVVRIPMEGQVASLNAASAGTVVLYEVLRQRRRNVPPADTRTPPPARAEPVTPQEEEMEYAEQSEADEAELQADLAQDERNTSEPMAVETDAIALGATQGAEDEGDADEAPPNEAEEATPKKRAPRARKAPTTKKPAARKKSAE